MVGKGRNNPPKYAPHIKPSDKEPRAPESGNTDLLYPSWRFNHRDREHWCLDHVSHQKLKEIIEYLHTRERMTWGAIKSQGKGHGSGSASHNIEISRLIPAARQRLVKLGFLDIDEVFSLRMSGKERLFGVIDRGVFKILWFDPQHEICPLSKH